CRSSPPRSSRSTPPPTTRTPSPGICSAASRGDRWQGPVPCGGAPRPVRGARDERRAAPPAVPAVRPAERDKLLPAERHGAVPAVARLDPGLGEAASPISPGSAGSACPATVSAGGRGSRRRRYQQRVALPGLVPVRPGDRELLPRPAAVGGAVDAGVVRRSVENA